MAAPGPPPPADPLADFLRNLGRLSIDDLALVALPEPDPDQRAELLQRAVDAAAGSGRRDLLAGAPARARDTLFRAYSRRGYDPTWFGLNWGRSLGRADDRARLVAAVEDAAVAAVVADLLPAEDVAALREPYEIAARWRAPGRTRHTPARGSSRRRPIVALAFVAGVLGVVVTGAYASRALSWQSRVRDPGARPSRRGGK